MELPDDVLGLIRTFSKPYRTRRDWKTCKVFESQYIHQFRRNFKYICYGVFYRNALLEETKEWTLHGLIHLFRRIKYILWPMDFPLRGRMVHDIEYYERRFLEFPYYPDIMAKYMILLI